MMKKKVVVILMFVGIFILVLCVKLAGSSREVSVMKNDTMGIYVVSDGQNEWIAQKMAELEKAGEIQPEQKEEQEQEPERDDWWNKWWHKNRCGMPYSAAAYWGSIKGDCWC